MIVVTTKNPQKHLDQILKAAKTANSDVAKTWSVRQSVNVAEKKIDVFWHDTSTESEPESQWADKGEIQFRVIDTEEEHEIRFFVVPVPPKKKFDDVAHYEKLHGRFVEMLMTYFRHHRNDLLSIAVTYPLPQAPAK